MNTIPSKPTEKEVVYRFESLTAYNHGFCAYMVGCERGLLYTWIEFGWKGFSTQYYFNVDRKFRKKKEARGTCRHFNENPLS